MSTKKNDKAPAEENPETKAEAQNAQAGQTQESPSGEKAAQEAETATQQNQAESRAEAELKAEKERFLRLLAEYDNYRKRSARERESIYADIRSDTVIKFLPVYDNLVRALEQSTEDEAYRKGVEMIMAQFKEILTAFGVTEIDALGKKFDPKLHEAVFHEGDETRGEGEIVQEFRKGFKMGDKVIRFAMVKVAN